MFLNWYSGIPKRKYIARQTNNNNFQQTDDFFCVVIKAMVIALCIRIAGCFTINDLQTWISRSDWLALISKVKRNHLGVFKVHDIRDKTSWKTVTMIVNIINVKKRVWLETGNVDGTKNPTKQ